MTLFFVFEDAKAGFEPVVLFDASGSLSYSGVYYVPDFVDVPASYSGSWFSYQKESATDLAVLSDIRDLLASLLGTIWAVLVFRILIHRK